MSSNLNEYPELPPPPGYRAPDFPANVPIPAHTPPVVSSAGHIVGNPPVLYAINPYKNTTCITALILGLATLVTFGFTGIPAVIAGHVALAQCKRGEANQKGMAVTGLVFGYLAVVGWTLWWLMLAVGMAGSGGS